MSLRRYLAIINSEHLRHGEIALVIDLALILWKTFNESLKKSMVGPFVAMSLLIIFEQLTIAT